MINLIRNLLINVGRWLDKREENSNYAGSKFENSPMPVMSSKSASVSSSITDMDGLNFTLYAATGGKVVQTSYYDNRTGNINRRLHIITDEMDLGEELAMIITRERLTA